MPTSPEAIVQSPSRRQAAGKPHLPAALLTVFVAFWLVLAIAPVNREDWLLENLLVFASVPVLVVTHRKLRFSDASYVCLFAFFCLHAVGAHYTYSLVPYDRWFETLTGHPLGDLLGFERNHFDRLVHFMYGLLLLLPSVELLRRYASLTSIWKWIVPVSFVASHSVIFEVIEMVAALLVAPELGDAYLGTQGDPWDAQKDMALALIGAALAMVVVAAVGRLRRTNG